MNVCNEVYIKKKHSLLSNIQTEKNAQFISIRPDRTSNWHSEGYRNCKEPTAKSFTTKWMPEFLKGCHLGNASFTPLEHSSNPTAFSGLSALKCLSLGGNSRNKLLIHYRKSYLEIQI